MRNDRQAKVNKCDCWGSDNGRGDSFDHERRNEKGSGTVAAEIIREIAVTVESRNKPVDVIKAEEGQVAADLG